MQGSSRHNRLSLALCACLLASAAPARTAHAAPSDAPTVPVPKAPPSEPMAPAAPPAPSDQTPQPPVAPHVASDVAPAPSLFHHMNTGPADDRDWAGAGDNADEDEDEDDAAADARFDSATPLPAPATERSREGRARAGHRHHHRGHGGEAEEGDADGEPKVAWVIEDRKAAHRAQLLSFGMGAWPTALSTHLLYAVPLLRQGLISPLNDAFHLEFGSLLTWGRADTVSLWPAAGVRWDFYLTRRWATFFDLKFAVEIQLNNAQNVRPNAIVGFGGFLRLAERLLLRLELNYPQGLSVGLAVPIGGP